MEGIVIRELCKCYSGEKGHILTALQDVSLEWQAGEFVALVGESGSGKSTLGKILLGLEQPDSGTIHMDGQELTNLHFSEWKGRRKQIQGVFQDASGTLNPRRSVYANMEAAMINLTELDRRQRREKIRTLMEMTGLSEDLLKVPVRQLSGGEQRRFSLLRAMTINPRYLVLDEATSGLDLVSSATVLKVLETYKKEMGCGFLFITHDMQSAYRLADRMVKMQHGRFVREGINKNKEEERIDYESKVI
ncbi:MAG: ABC transporter ATP-binding protein [Lachnospiraceae bacterium]